MSDRPVTPVARSSGDVTMTVRDVRKTFRIHQERANSLKQLLVGGGRNRYEEFVALDGVSFDVPTGQALGIIGHNGSGKSTLLKCMARILQPNAGEITITKSMAGLLELGAGFHPELSGRDNVFLNAAILGMNRRDIADRFDEIVAFSGLEEFIEQPVKTYSSGMYVRLAFAVAIHVDPELLLIDEILAVGDVEFQQKCMQKFVEFRQRGRTLVLVTHDTGTVREFCDRAIWLHHGVIQADGDPAPVIDDYNETMLGGTAEGDAGAIRRGDGPLRIDRVELRTDGTTTGSVRTGETLTVRLHWSSEAPVDEPVVEVRLTTLAGQDISAPASSDSGLRLGRLSGTGVIDVEFPEIALLPGPYLVHTEVTGPSRQMIFDHVQNAASFDVHAGDSPETHGVVTLRPRWTSS